MELVDANQPRTAASRSTTARETHDSVPVLPRITCSTCFSFSADRESRARHCWPARERAAAERDFSER